MRKIKKARIFPGLCGLSGGESRYNYIVCIHAQNGTRPWQGRQQAHLVPHMTDIPLKITYLSSWVKYWPWGVAPAEGA